MSTLEMQLISLKETSESNSKRVEDLSSKLKQVMSLVFVKRFWLLDVYFACLLEIHYTYSLIYDV